MRKKFVYFVLIPAVLFCLLLYIFLDGLVETGLETAGEAMVGAKVEIENLHVSLSPLGIRWGRMQVADPNDPWKNIVETRDVRFALNVGQLLRNKYIIETMEINELILGTKRTTDGSIPRPPKAETPQGGEGSSFTSLAKGVLDKTVEKTPLTNLDMFKGGFNADSLVKALDIRTLKHLDSLKQQAIAASTQWDAARGEFESSRQKLTDIENGVKAINTSQLNTVPAITSAITTVDNAVKGINEISSAFNARKASIVSTVSALSASAAMTDKVVADDFAHLKSMARLPNLNTMGIASLLVGDEMVQRAKKYLAYVDFARAHIKNSQSTPAYEAPPARMKGQNIHFPLEQAYPKFWVQHALISGGKGTATDSAGEYIRAKGEIKNITNDQSVTRLPMTAALEGVEGGGRAFSLTAVVDRTKETPYDEYTATLHGVPLGSFTLGKEDFLAGTMTRARMESSVKVKVPGSAFDATSTMTLSGFSLQFAKEPKNVLERIVREVLQGINAFDVGLRLWNTGGGFDLALSTDLDTKIAGQASSVLGAEFTKAQNELKAKLDGVIAGKRAEVERLVADKRGEIEKQVGSYQSLLNDKLAVADSKKKELTDLLEKQQKGKINDVLKGIFKK